MKNQLFLLFKTIIFSCLLIAFSRISFSQVGCFTKNDLLEYTREWKGERFPDGRPKVSDEILEQMKKVPITLAWSILCGEGYNCQYDDSEWKMVHPDQTIVGRVLTVKYMPERPGVNAVNEQRGKKLGSPNSLYSWGVEMLQEGDIYVADGFGKKITGYIGDNYAGAIYAKSHNAAIINGSVRDLEGIKNITGFNALFRNWYPAGASNVMLMGVNVPVLIGSVTVMPGDVVLAKREGLLFIPPHLAEKIVKSAEINSLRDKFGIQRMIEKKIL